MSPADTSAPKVSCAVGPPSTQAEVYEVIPDLTGQLAAVLPRVGHEQHVTSGQPARHIRLPGLGKHLLTAGPSDPAVLVVILQGRLVPQPQPQAGLTFPLLSEPDRHRQLRESPVVRYQAHGPARLDSRQLLGVTGEQHLAAGPFGPVMPPPHRRHTPPPALAAHSPQ